MSKKKFSGIISGKGYYIALILCAVAIGISGYLYYRHVEKEQTNLQNKPNSGIQGNDQNDIPAAATQPGDTNEDPANPSGGNQQNPSPKPSRKPTKTASPVDGELVAHYSMTALSYNVTTRDWRVHNGVDIAAEAGTKVCAAADGTVEKVYSDEKMGTTIVISHSGGYTTQYSSLAKEVSVEEGDTVQVGQTIGAVGCTALLETAIGDHIHFSVRCDGEVINPVDFLPKE